MDIDQGDVLIPSQSQDYAPRYEAYQHEAYNELLEDINDLGQFPNDNDFGAGNVGISANAQFSSQILDDDGTFPLVSFVNSLSCWHLPTLDHSSWFCIGIYIILMVVIPFIKDGSTSIIFALNIPIFIAYCAWYRWFAETSVSDILALSPCDSPIYIEYPHSLCTPCKW